MVGWQSRTRSHRVAIGTRLLQEYRARKHERTFKLGQSPGISPISPLDNLRSVELSFNPKVSHDLTPSEATSTDTNISDISSISELKHSLQTTKWLKIHDYASTRRVRLQRRSVNGMKSIVSRVRFWQHIIRHWYATDRSDLALKEATYTRSRQLICKIFNRVVMTRIFSAWQQRFNRDQSIIRRLLALHTRHRLLERTFRPWHEGTSHRTERNGDLAVLLLRRRFQIFNRVIRSWRQSVDDQWSLPVVPDPPPPAPPDTPRLSFRRSERCDGLHQRLRELQHQHRGSP